MVTYLGGIAAALAFLSRRKLPRPGQFVIAFAGTVPCAWVWPSDQHPGYFHMCGVDLGEREEDAAHAYSSRRPIRGEVIVSEDGNIYPVWYFLGLETRGRVTNFETIDGKINRDTVEIFGGSLDGVAQ